MKLPLHYRLNRVLVAVIAWITNHCTFRSVDAAVDLSPYRIRKILLVRANFRLGDSIMASAAVDLFRRRFSRAKIDFVGWSTTRSLFESLPIACYYGITRRFPQVCWQYVRLINRLRSRCYDLAVDVSCSHSALGSFIVGLSGARWRVGLEKKSDRWLNVRLPRPKSKNKYCALPELLAALGLPAEHAVPRVALSAAERENGRKMLAAIEGAGPLVGVFVGGRLSVGKRWPVERFRQVIAGLRSSGARVAIFVGPEEKRLLEEFASSCGSVVMVFYEPALRSFASMLSGCDLFVASDSGPMHLACAVGTRTVALFQKPSFTRWGPPRDLARIVYEPGGPTVCSVLAACAEELSGLFPNRVFKPVERDKVPESVAVARRAPSRQSLWPNFLFLPGFVQAIFLTAMLVYAWFAPPSFVEETWLDVFVDGFGVLNLLACALLRVWAISHAERCPLWSQGNPERMITGGPYAYIRHPIYVGNFLAALGLIFLADAYILLPLLFCLAIFQHRVIIRGEDELLQTTFGRLFTEYRTSVPAYMPRVVPRPADFSLQRDFQLRAFTYVWGIVFAAFLFEWIESPVHREWLRAILHRLV